MPEPFVPTQEQRGVIQMMAALKMPRQDMLAMINIDRADGEWIDYRTLTDAFRREMTLGPIIATLAVGKKIYSMATSPENTSDTFRAARYWMAKRGGWDSAIPMQVEQEAGKDARLELLAKVEKYVGSRDRERHRVVSLDAARQRG